MEAVADSLLLGSPALDVAGQMALDDALLEAPPAHFVLRLFRWSARPAVTFGYFQKEAFVRGVLASFGPPWADAPAVRRPTGGGIVLHEADVTFSVILADSRSLSPQAAYKDLHRGVHQGLKAAGVVTALWSPPGWRDAPKCPAEPCDRESAACFSGPEPMDLVLGERKVLGGALRRRGTRLLYQGSLQLPARLLPIERVEAALAKGLGLEWGGAPEPGAAGPALLARASELARARYSSSDWNSRR